MTCDERRPTLTRVPASEWRQLTEAEQRQRIRDGFVPYSDLDPETKAIVDDMMGDRWLLSPPDPEMTRTATMTVLPQ